MTAVYPQPPWHAHGRAWIQPYLVSADALELPRGFRAVSIAGRCVGVLALIDYVAPSPLVYRELAWMPCMVSAGGARGYFIAKIYVDSEASLAGGRELWAIPKQLAKFAIGETLARVDTDDGARLELHLSRRGPSLPMRAAAGTLQARGDDLVRFTCRGTARVGSGGFTVTSAAGMDGWNGWRGARRIPALGAALSSFALAMMPAKQIAIR